MLQRLCHGFYDVIRVKHAMLACNRDVLQLNPGLAANLNKHNKFLCANMRAKAPLGQIQRLQSDDTLTNGESQSQLHVNMF